MRIVNFLPAIAVAALAASCVPVSARTVTPSTLVSALAEARGGETLTLEAGDYGVVKLPQRAFFPKLTVDSRAARVSGWVIHNAIGVEIDGGVVTGEAQRYAVSIRAAKAVRIANMRIGGAVRGIVVAGSEGVVLVGNTLDSLVSDGINIVDSRQVRVEGNSCGNFSPTASKFENGVKISEGHHPDCIQAWSVQGKTPLSDIAIVNNTGEGRMQGVFFGNGTWGGVDRLEVRGNRFRLAMPNGIVVTNARGAVVRDNVLETIQGTIIQGRRPFAVKTKLLVEGTDLNVCGNKVTSVPNSQGTQKCR